jgi:arylsulfatase
VGPDGLPVRGADRVRCSPAEARRPDLLVLISIDAWNRGLEPTPCRARDGCHASRYTSSVPKTDTNRVSDPRVPACRRWNDHDDPNGPCGQGDPHGHDDPYDPYGQYDREDGVSDRRKRIRRRAGITTFGCVTLGLSLLLFCGACARWDPPPPQLLLLISIDTLRPDRLGSYGHDRPTSPHLDAVAAEGVVFEDVTSTAPWTFPAHVSMLTGLYPATSGVDERGAAIPDDVATLASWLSQQGFATAGIVNSLYLTQRSGFHRGFEEFFYVREDVDQREPSRLITDRARQWLGTPDERRRFLFLHYYDVHSDYVSLPEFEAAFVAEYDGPVDGTTKQLGRARRGLSDLNLGPADHERLFDLYDAGIRQLDEELARLLRYLDESGWSERTLLVVTSDHGEEFGEHGSYLHGRTQYQEVVRIPLILRGPGVPEGVRVATPVSLVDVAPTLLSTLGVKPPDGLDGIDLSPLWQRDVNGLELRMLYSEADWKNVIPDATRSVRQGRFKLVTDRATGSYALYDLESDPGETRDVASGHPAVAQRLLERLERRMGRQIEAPRARALDLSETERLRSLGYLD